MRVLRKFAVGVMHKLSWVDNQTCQVGVSLYGLFQLALLIIAEEWCSAHDCALGYMKCTSSFYLS